MNKDWYSVEFSAIEISGKIFRCRFMVRSFNSELRCFKNFLDKVPPGRHSIRVKGLDLGWFDRDKE